MDTKKRNRWVYFPLAFISWAMQFTLFSICLGLAAIIIGIIGILMSLIFPDEDGDITITDQILMSLGIMAMPFVCPIYFWIRYWKEGTIGTL